MSADVLNSNKQFAEELTRRLKAAKLKVPMKRAKPRKDGSTPLIPALAKGDAAFIALADSSVDSVSSLIKARLVERSAVTVAARWQRWRSMQAWALVSRSPGLLRCSHWPL
jgi:hypothetical protein